MGVPDINVLLYTDRTRTADETAGRIPAIGETTTWSRGRGTRSSS